MGSHTVITPGFYKTNYRAISIRELIRWRGLFHLPQALIIARSKPPADGYWLPVLWGDHECTKQELSDRFWQKTASHRQTFAQLGFRECGVLRLKPHLNLSPLIRDTGKIIYLDSSRSHIGMVIYSRIHAPLPIDRDRERVAVEFTTAFQNGSLSCTNNFRQHDPISGHDVVRIASDDPGFIYGRFVQRVHRRREAPIVFIDDESLHRWFDSSQLEEFESWVQRGLYIRMSDQEVEEARRKLPPPLLDKT